MKVFGVLSYLLTIAGAGGMIVFSQKFPLTTAIWMLKHTQERFLGLNGYEVWIASWLFIISGSLVQGILYVIE
jgi:hypothetical protein